MWGDKARAFDPSRTAGTRTRQRQGLDLDRDAQGRFRSTEDLEQTNVADLPLAEALDEIFMNSHVRVLASLRQTVIHIQDRMREEGIYIDWTDLQLEEHRK